MKIFFLIILLGTTTLSAKEKTYYEVDYNIDIAITITAILIGIMPPLTVKKLPDYMKNEKLDVSNVNSFDSMTIYNYNGMSAKVSDYMIVGMGLMPFAVNWIGNNGSSYLKESIIITESIAISAALNSIVKYAVSRPRPYIYSGKATDGEKDSRDAHLSFYSGHSTFAFTAAVSFASIMDDRFDKTWQKSLIWGVPLALASTVAYLRINAGKHFLIDVLTGAIIGSSIGYLVPYLHKKSSGNIIVAGTSDAVMLGYSGTF